MQTVYIVNEPLRRNPVNGKFERFMNFSSALRYGRLEHLLPAGTLMHDMDYVRDELRAKLETFDRTDYLVCVGHPVALMEAAVLAVQKTNGLLRVLRWHNQLHVYDAMHVDMLASRLDQSGGIPLQPSNAAKA